MILTAALLLLLVPLSHGQDKTKHIHCDVFRSHYEIYCTGIWTPEKLLRLSNHLEKIEQFCPNYKKNCLQPKKKLRHGHMTRAQRRKLQRELKYDLSYDDILKRLADVIPCTPDCKQPHCTPECKCDYDWPTFQKFCYPMTVKEFEMSCSLWFDRCPAYAKKADEEGPGEERDIVTHAPLDEMRRQIYERMG